MKEKKSYSAPQLKRHGSVEQLTHDLVKTGGYNDYYCQQSLNPPAPSKCC